MLRWTLACCATLPLGTLAACAQTLTPRPVRAILTGRSQDLDLRESSGVALSRAHPGVLFTINGSGNPPEIFATDRRLVLTGEATPGTSAGPIHIVTFGG
jgi:hypothetical protein